MTLPAIRLGVYLRYARVWILIAVIPAIIAGALGYVYTKHQPRTYAATSTLLVQQSVVSGATISGIPDPIGSAQLAQTYSQLATQQVVAQAADKLLAKQYPGYRVEDHGLSSNANNLQGQSPLITLSVTDALPVRAANAANAVATAFIAQIKQLNDARYAADLRTLDDQIARAQANINRITSQINGYRGSTAGLDALRTEQAAYQSGYQSLLLSSEQLKLTRDAGNDVSLYSAAIPPSGPIGPHPTRNAVLWAFLVLLLGSAIIYAYEYLSDLPSSPQEIEELAGAPILAAVSSFDRRTRPGQLVTSTRPHSPAAEAYRLVRTNIQFTDVDHPPRTIVVTSPLPRDGKTTTASNLAQVFAEGGKRVTLVDADLRRPGIGRLFDVSRDDGLTNMLVADHLNGTRPNPTSTANLSVLGSGPLPPNPADLLSSDRMRDVLAYLRSTSDVVLVDSPPILAVADAAILATMADGVVLVLDPSKTRRHQIRRARESIEAVGGRILGVVINRMKSHGHLYYTYGYYGENYGPKSGGKGKGRGSSRPEPPVIDAAESPVR